MPAPLYKTSYGWSPTPERVAANPAGSAYENMKRQEAENLARDAEFRRFEGQQQGARDQHMARRSQRNAAVNFDVEGMDRQLSSFGDDMQALAARDPMGYQRAMELKARKAALIAQQQQEDTGDDRDLAVSQAAKFQPSAASMRSPAAMSAPSRVSAGPQTSDDPYSALALRQQQEAQYANDDQQFRGYEAQQQQMADQVRARKAQRLAAQQFDVGRLDTELGGLQESDPRAAMRRLEIQARRADLARQYQTEDEGDDRELAISRATPFAPRRY